MVEAVALNSIKNENGQTIGYKLKDNEGTVRDIKSDAIINAMKKNLINISNLSITSDNKLVMIEKSVENNSKTKVKQPVLVENKSEKEELNNKTATDNTNMERMHQLIERLNLARKVYEQGTDEIMSNYEYDKLYDELVNLEHKLGTVLSNSPTINVGYEVVSNLPKKKHAQPMLSLDKTKDREELKSFLQNKEGILSWKLDGLTVVLTYENGDLVEGVTRGNGEIGEVVTPNVKQFKNVPRHIAFNNRLVLRGEAVIRYSTFDAINSHLGIDEEKYKNPRNLCSGSVRQLDSRVTAQRDVEWYCFDIVECEKGNIGKNLDEQFNFVKVLGFETVDYRIVNSSTILDTIKKFEQIVTSKKLDVPSDGLVLTFRDREYGNSLGRTAKSPRHSKAFKWQDETAITSLLDIEWQVGRSGIITPVAIFEPVDIEGSTVGRATLHNLSIMEEVLGHPYYKQKIEVYKANMIIPNILWGDKKDDAPNKFYIPSYCPCCSCETEIREEPKSGVLTLWCPNDYCEAKGNRLMEHFVSRDAMNIDGISGATLQKLSEVGIISDFVSIYHIHEHEDIIVNMEGFGEQSFTNMVNAIDKSRNVKLANLIYALGIPNIGLATAKLICKHFENDMEKTVTASYSDLVNIDGIGEVIAQSFVDYFRDHDNVDQFIKLIDELTIVKEEVSTNTTMAGITICVTGDVYIFPNRRAIKDLVEDLGGKLTGSVSKSTTYLVTNDTTSGSRKNKAAQEYGIPILTEKEFIDKFNLQV